METQNTIPGAATQPSQTKHRSIHTTPVKGQPPGETQCLPYQTHPQSQTNGIHIKLVELHNILILCSYSSRQAVEN